MKQPEKPSQRQPLGVYVHFPFCRSKCGYCDFASAVASELPHRRYAEAVVRELAGRQAAFAGRELRSIYMGGGTPSLWDPGEVGRVLRAISRAFSRSTGPEVTLEVNPGTVDSAALAALGRVGVNRLSIGVQSLDDASLRLLTRTHDGRAAGQAVRRARQEGFENISCDLICGLPGQTLDHHRRQLLALLDLEPDHVSLYALTLSSRCALRRAGHRPVADDLMAEMLESGRELLAGAGLPQYEVSNFAPAPRRSIQNTLVWQGGAYLGLGASAHSMRYEGAVTFRTANPALDEYLAGEVLPHPHLPAVAGARRERLSGDQARHEVLFLGLRTTAGVDRAFFCQRFGDDPLRRHGEVLERLVGEGLLTISRAWIKPTARGIWFADELALRLMT